MPAVTIWVTARMESGGDPVGPGAEPPVAGGSSVVRPARSRFEDSPIGVEPPAITALVEGRVGWRTSTVGPPTGEIAFASGRVSDALPLLLKAARRLEPLDALHPARPARPECRRARRTTRRAALHSSSTHQENHRTHHTPVGTVALSHHEDRSPQGFLRGPLTRVSARGQPRQNSRQRSSQRPRQPTFTAGLRRICGARDVGSLNATVPGCVPRHAAALGGKRGGRVSVGDEDEALCAKIR